MSGGKAHEFCFPRAEHLKKRGEIQEVFRKGKSVSVFGLKLFYLQAELHSKVAEKPENPCQRRIAFTFSAKFGNAAARNRAKRLCREAYRHLRPCLKGGFDLVVLIYGAKPENPPKSEVFKQVAPFSALDFDKRQQQLRNLFRKAELL
jgi:ribonuclease P protein component